MQYRNIKRDDMTADDWSEGLRRTISKYDMRAEVANHPSMVAKATDAKRVLREFESAAKDAARERMRSEGAVI